MPALKAQVERPSIDEIAINSFKCARNCSQLDYALRIHSIAVYSVDALLPIRKGHRRHTSARLSPADAADEHEKLTTQLSQAEDTIRTNNVFHFLLIADNELQQPSQQLWLFYGQPEELLQA